MNEHAEEWDDECWPQDDWPYQGSVRRSDVNTLTRGPRAAPGHDASTGANRPGRGFRWRERNHDTGPVPYWRTYRHR